MPEQVEFEDKNNLKLNIALVGRPNVGKSSIINALLQDTRTIVSDIVGTTRDAIDVPFSHGGIDYTLIDTAGLRSRNKQNTSVEVFSGMRTKTSIKRADICVLVVDAAQGPTSQDRKIANLINKSNTPCLIVANKFDLYHPTAPKTERLEAINEDIDEQLFFLPYAPIVATSAKTGESIRRLFFGIEQIRKSSSQVLNTGSLNRLLQNCLIAHPPPAGKGGKRFKLLYATMSKESAPQKQYQRLISYYSAIRKVFFQIIMNVTSKIKFANNPHTLEFPYDLFSGSVSLDAQDNYPNQNAP